MKHISLAYIITTVLFTALLSCASWVPDKESWEGFEGGTLRICIYYEYPADFDGRINTSTREQLQNLVRSRAEMILLSYIRLHVAGIDRGVECQQMIPDIVAKGTERRLACDIHHCEAYYDFNVVDFLKATGISIYK